MSSPSSDSRTSRDGQGAASWPLQLRLLTGVALRESIRNPVLALNLLLAILFLLVYDGTVGELPLFLEIAEGNYFNFLLPAAILAGSVGGGAAGLILVNDLNTGYLQRQLTMPLRRSVLIASLLIVAGIQVVLQCAGVIGFALVLGADPETGPAGYAAVLGLALLWGASFAAYSIAIAITTADVEMTAAANLIFIPLIFCSPLLVPYQYLKPWMQSVADVNPTRYLMEAIRSIFLGNSSAELLLNAVAACSIFLLIMLIAAALAVRTRLPKIV